MKNTIALLMAVILCLLFAACEPKQNPQEVHTEPTFPQETNPIQPDAEEKQEDAIQESIELVGPWHLHDEKNDLTAFADSLDLFPGYGEWGASMEIRSNGQMGWYIGAEGWHGTYTVEDGVIQAQLVSDLEQSTQLWSFRILVENGEALLEMDYQDMTIYWAYGDREDTPAIGTP